MRKAIAITFSNRYDYIDKCFESLSKNNLSGYDLWFFVDVVGSIGAIEYLASKHGLPKAVYVGASHPLNASGNIHRTKTILFDKCNYDFVLYLDDDTILAKSFVSLHTKLLEWGIAKWDNIGFIGCWNGWAIDKEKKQNELNHVYANANTSMTCGMTKKCWDGVKEEMYYYEKEILPYNYANRPLAKENRDKLYLGCPTQYIENSVPDLLDLRTAVEGMLTSWHIGQDIVLGAIAVKKGWSGLTTVVTRCTNIGAIGEHSTPESWDTAFLKTIVLDQFDEDELITEFNLITK